MAAAEPPSRPAPPPPERPRRHAVAAKPSVPPSPPLFSSHEACYQLQSNIYCRFPLQFFLTQL